MNLFTQINKLEQIHFHIEHKSTGRPKEFARRLRISERTLFRLLGVLKDYGVEIEYNRLRSTYEYKSKYGIPDLLRFNIKSDEPLK